ARPRPGPVRRATTASPARPRPRPVRRTTTASGVLSPGSEQSLPRKPRRMPIPATAAGRRSDAASSTSRPLAKAAAALAPARIRTRKGQASPAPTGIPATSTRISVRRGSTLRSSCRRSNDDNRDQRIFPLVWSRVALGSVRDSNPWPSLAAAVQAEEERKAKAAAEAEASATAEQAEKERLAAKVEEER